MSASTKKKLRKEQNAAQLTEKQLKEKKEAKKLKISTTIFTVAIVVVLCAAIAVMIGSAVLNSGSLQRNTVALTVGEHEVSSAELNYFFVDVVNENYNNWTNAYGDYTQMYLSAMGLDLTMPLDEQVYLGSEDGTTYADHFLKTAISNAANAYTVYDLAVAENHTMSDEIKTSMESTLSTMKMYASFYGYTDFNDYLKLLYGAGATEESYTSYLNVLATADSYQEAYYDGLSYDASALSAYNDEHFDDFSYFNYSEIFIYTKDFVTCTAAEDDTEHEHTAEEIAAAEAAVKKAGEDVLALNPTTPEELEDAVATLDVYAEAKKLSTPYEDNLLSSISSEELAEWLAAKDRQVGDCTMVPYYTTDTETQEESLYGYYIAVFEGRNDNLMNLVNVRHILAAFEGGTTDESGNTTYSVEEKAVAKERIEEIKAEWLENGGDEEAFKALVAENSDDEGSVAIEGLYEDIYPGKTVEAFNDWCFAEGRKTGDYEIVETEHGYHLIYFVSTDEVVFRDYMIENTLRNQDYEAWYEEVTADVAHTVHTTRYLDLDMILSRS